MEPKLIQNDAKHACPACQCQLLIHPDQSISPNFDLTSHEDFEQIKAASAKIRDKKPRGRKKSGPVSYDIVCEGCSKVFSKTYTSPSMHKHRAPRTCSKVCASVLAARTYLNRCETNL